MSLSTHVLSPAPPAGPVKPITQVVGAKSVAVTQAAANLVSGSEMTDYSFLVSHNDVPIAAVGRVFQIVRIDPPGFPVGIRPTGKGDFVYYFRGEGAQVREGFDQLELHNPTPQSSFVPLTVTLRISNSPQLQEQTLSQPIETITVGTGVAALGAGATTALTQDIKLNGGITVRQRTFIVSNLDAANVVYIANAVAVIAVVFPKTTLSVDSSDVLQVQNPNGAPVNICIGQVCTPLARPWIGS